MIMIDQPQISIFSKRYILEGLLGQGGMGIVYRAKDRLTGNIVALKRVLSTNQELLLADSESGIDLRLALAQEFQLLASLRHPYIISVLDYGFDDEKLPYYTMDYVPNAQDIREAAHGKSIPERIRLLIQVVQALAYLHRRGIVHHDLKPANVLVKDGQVKVLDFGLAAVAGQAHSRVMGTLTYLAPELLAGQPASMTADLYAVGLLAYEILTSEYPFDVDDTTKLMYDIVNTAPDVSVIGIDSPLAKVVKKLLEKAPADRYQDALSVIAAFSEAIGQPIPIEDEAIRESFLQAAPLVGRETELATLTEALQNTLHYEGNAWLLSGESGVGKSRLLTELATLALIRGMLVLRGQAVQEGTQPFQIWREPLKRLILAADLSELEISVLKDGLPEISELLERSIPDAPFLEIPARQARLLSTISSIFQRQRQPVVLMLEDLQWVDQESLLLVRQLKTMGRPLLIIGSYRDDEHSDVRVQLSYMKFLKLDRLSKTEIGRLSESILGDSGRQPEVVSFLHRETEGNVFFLIEVIRALAEEAGQLADAGKGNLPEHVFAGGVKQVIQRRLAHVSPTAWPMLKFAAVFGREIDLRILSTVNSVANVQKWLTECVNAAVLDISNEHWRFAHDKLREGVLTGLTPNERRVLHEQVAQAIELVYRGQESQAAILAYHWKMAGNELNEAHYSQIAGEQAHQISANNEAIQFFRRALELASRDKDKAYLTNRIAESLFWLGDFNGSTHYNQQALTLARSHTDFRLISASLKNLGNTAIQQGQYPIAITYLTESLEIARQMTDLERTSDALFGLGDVTWRVGDNAQAMTYLQESLTIARKLQKPSSLGSALNMVGIVSAMQGNLDKAKESFQEALSLFRQIGDRSRVAQALSNLAESLLLEGSYSEAIIYLKEALHLSLEVNNRFSTANIQLSLGMSALELNQQEDARHYFTEALQTSTQIDSPLLMLGAVGGFARLAADQGQTTAALELIGLVKYHPSSSPDLQNLTTQRIFDKLKDQIPSAVFIASLERGKALDLKKISPALLAGEIDFSQPLPTKFDVEPQPGQSPGNS